jgi:hypothetical protein
MSKDFDLGYISHGFVMSQKARDYFDAMTEAEWIAWQPRYLALIDLSSGKQRELQNITWWEQEFLEGMLSVPCMTENLKKN